MSSATDASDKKNNAANPSKDLPAAGSPSVSEIRYWMEGQSWLNGEKNEFGDEGATYLSYDVFLGLSVLGGFFALDHLYLRSPWTFLAKFCVNIFCFGVWWFYDAIQALFNTDTIRVFGLSVPGMGPMGIAAGVLAEPQPSKKHWRFFTYAAALFFGGIFGLDSFLVGDRRSGVIRLVSLVSMIGLPIALLWWAYRLFQFFTNTKDVVSEYGTYFGGATGTTLMGASWLSWLFNPVDWLKKMVAAIAEPVILPITNTIQAVTGTVDKTVDTVGKTVDLGREAITKGAQVVNQVTQGLSAAQSVVPGAALYASVTPAAVSAAKGLSSAAKGLPNGVPNVAQSGGSPFGSSFAADNLLPSVLLITLFVISLVGGLATLVRSHRAHKADSPHKDRNDVPPEPSTTTA